MFNSVLRSPNCSLDWRFFRKIRDISRQADRLPAWRERFLHGDRPVEASRLDEKFVQAWIVAELDAATAGTQVIGDHFHGPAADAAAQRQQKPSRLRAVIVLRCPRDAKRSGFADEPERGAARAFPRAELAARGFLFCVL